MKYLEDDLVDAINLIKDYLTKHCPGGSIRLSGSSGTLVVVSQDPDVVDGINEAFDEYTDHDGYEELTTVTVKDEGEA